MNEWSGWVSCVEVHHERPGDGQSRDRGFAHAAVRVSRDASGRCSGAFDEGTARGVGNPVGARQPTRASVQRQDPPDGLRTVPAAAFPLQEAVKAPRSTFSALRFVTWRYLT